MTERNSNFDWLRLFLAASVAYFHAGYFSSLANGGGAPFTLILFPMVPTFLALSGFLMFRSFATSAHYGHFAWKRALRILPGLLLALALSGLVWGFDRGFVGSALTYLGGGIFFGSTGNGSLWSLLWEEIAYGLMAVLLSLGAYNRRWLIWCLLTASCAIAAWWNQVEPVWRITNLAPALFTGNLVFLYRDRISRLPWQAILASIVVITAVNKGFDFQPQAWYMVPVGCGLALMLCLSAPQLPRLRADVSYGLYVFHDPIYSAASRIWPHSFADMFFPGTVALIVISLISWYLVEKPALAFKGVFPRRVPMARPQSSRAL